MSDAISPRAFRAAGGTEDWRVVGDGARAYFVTGSFAAGAAFVTAIQKLADAAGHHPEVDLRYAGVGIRLLSHDIGDLSERDVALARGISQKARELGLRPEPAAVQSLQIAIDAVDRPAVLRFWQAVLAYEPWGDGEEDLSDPHRLGPNIWIQQIDAHRAERNTIHVDLYVPRDQVESRLAAALAAGGRIASDAGAPDWWTLADPEGNEVDLAPWRDDSDWPA
ncbi:VOC family protein [Herbiconiux sp. YIM B11900]|uniref:VOC family protein n=1 Tax=Herbiconiux sp. YIM B11900 TaxID=3404131 RepID=UPI003F8482C9